MAGIMKAMATSFKGICACTVVFRAPDPVAGHCQPTSPPETPRHSFKSGSVSCGVTAPFSWVLVWTVFGRVTVSPVLEKFCSQIPLTFKVKFPGGYDTVR